MLHLDVGGHTLARSTEREVEPFIEFLEVTRKEFAMQTENATEIAKLNDQFRRGGFDFVVTPGVQTLENLHLLIDEVRDFREFNDHNDPYGEHDFGTVHWYGEKVFWKIDYYDQELSGWHDPLEPGCRRVLTLMLASEY